MTSYESPDIQVRWTLKWLTSVSYGPNVRAQQDVPTTLCACQAPKLIPVALGSIGFAFAVLRILQERSRIVGVALSFALGCATLLFYRVSVIPLQHARKRDLAALRADIFATQKAWAHEFAAVCGLSSMDAHRLPDDDALPRIRERLRRLSELVASEATLHTRLEKSRPVMDKETLRYFNEAKHDWDEHVSELEGLQVVLDTLGAMGQRRRKREIQPIKQIGQCTD